MKTVDPRDMNYSSSGYNFGSELVELPLEIVSNISIDQSQFYQLVQAVRSDILLALRKTWPEHTADVR